MVVAACIFGLISGDGQTITTTTLAHRRWGFGDQLALDAQARQGPPLDISTFRPHFFVLDYRLKCRSSFFLHCRNGCWCSYQGLTQGSQQPLANATKSGEMDDDL
jgi:hypothetical protein